MAGARHEIESSINKYCEKIGYDQRYIRELRALSNNLPGDTIDICPNALKLSDVDPNNEVKAILDNAFKSFAGYEAPIVN